MIGKQIEVTSLGADICMYLYGSSTILREYYRSQQAEQA
jgi:hypothetical protein